MRRPDASPRATRWLVVPLVLGASLCLLDPASAARAEPKDGGADARKPDPPKATIVVPASIVARALEKRDVGATNAVAPDGRALGAKLVGVSKYRSGLRDGDIVVSVSGRKTPNVDAIVAAGILAAASGATRLSGRILRGSTTFDVLLELPK